MPSGSKNAIIDSRGLWTNKIIPYVIDAAYSIEHKNYKIPIQTNFFAIFALDKKNKYSARSTEYYRHCHE